MMSHDSNGDAFRSALDEAGRVPRTLREDKGAPFPAPWLEPFPFGPERGGGGEARWDLAMEWADEPLAFHALTVPNLPSNPAPAPANVAEAVARELDFHAGLSAEAVTERWRAFVWRNHPDRQPADAREQANARVAVANALYDRARRALRYA